VDAADARGLLAPHPVAIELRRRSWVRDERAEDTLGWLEAHHAVWVAVDAPAPVAAARFRELAGV
jgi:uncharacterized protein YecE (DUF72 family)